MRIPDVGTLAPAIDAKPDVAPVFVVRTGGLPVPVLDDLATPETVRALAAAADHEARAAELADRLSESLYRAVPTVGDRAARGRLIKLRRAIHNGREPGAGSVGLLAHLPDAVAGEVRDWLDRTRLAAAERAAAGRAFDAETARSAAAMREHLRRPSIALGLSLASPQFTGRLLAGPLSSAPESRSARSATAYLSRIAVKTSPFSTLTTVAAGSFGPRAHSAAGPASGDRSTRCNRALVVALLLACARQPPAADLLTVATVEGLRRVDGRWLANLPNRVLAGGTAVRLDELTDCELLAWAADVLPDGQVAFGALLASAAAEAAGGPSRVRRLLDVGLLQPVLPGPATGRSDLTALAAWLRRHADGRLNGFAGAVDRLAAGEAAVATAPGPADRCAAADAARTAARDAFAALGQPEPAWLDTLPLFHEMAGTPGGTRPDLPPAVRADLAEAGRWLAPHTWRSRLYDELVAAFVARHGAGAAGVDLVDFLYAFLSRADLAGVAARPVAVDRDRAGDPERLRGAGTVAAASWAVFFQLAAGSAEAVAAGAYDLVVNAVHTGGLGLLGRWTRVPTVHDQLAAPLATWADGSHPGCRVYQVSPYADWVDIQQPVLRTLPRLRLPGDLPDDGVTTDLAGMTLAHDPAGDTLQAFGRAGEPVAFSYLGTMPAHLLHGVAQLVCLLSHPWLLIGRVDRDRLAVDDRAAPVFQPRRQRGRIVWARARWSVPVGDLPVPGPQGTPVGFFDTVRRWRTGLGLPAEVFATQVRRTGRWTTKSKPQWLGFEHPHAVWAALGRVPAGTSVVDFAEALPGRGQHWSTDPDGQPVATEHLGLVRHA